MDCVWGLRSLKTKLVTIMRTRWRAYYCVGLLDGNCSCDVPSYLETCTDEDDDEVVRFIQDDGLYELDYHRDGKEDSADDGEREARIGEPDGVGIFLRHDVPCSKFSLITKKRIEGPDTSRGAGEWSALITLNRETLSPL